MNDHGTDKIPPAKGKRGYSAPMLQIYGDFREITNTVTKTGLKADPGHPTPRTR